MSRLNQSEESNLVHSYGGIAFGDPVANRASILSYVSEHVQSHGDDPFVTAVSNEDSVRTLSYWELDVLSRRLAYWFQKELQVRPKDVIALLPANDITSVLAIFGLLRSGCALLFLNGADPVVRLRQQMEASGAKTVVRAPAVPPDTLPEAIRVRDVSALDEVSMLDLDPPLDPTADALVFGTSGSTAVSKLVVQSHYNTAVNAEGLLRHHGLRRRDRFLGCLPIHHVNGLHFTIFATLAAGAHAILANSFDPFTYGRLIKRFRPRVASVVPSILEVLLETWREPTFPGDFNYFVSAAAPLSARTARAVAQKFGVRVLQGYGLTETTNFSTTMPTDLSQEAYQSLMEDAEIPSIGSALYGNEVAVLTEDGKRVGPGEVGEICMRGFNVMTRYEGNAAATAEAFRNGWFHSQDIGYEIMDRATGRSFFVITGRSKNIAKVKGEAVSLDEMERVLLVLPQVRDAGCVSFPHRFLGDEIIAAVVLSQEAPESDLRSHLRAIFAASALPRRIVSVDEIPRTPTGKIRRAELTQRLASLSEDDSAQ